MGERGAIHVAGQVRGAGRAAGDDLATKRGRGEGQGAALAGAVDADPACVDLGSREQEVDGAGGVGVEAAVAVGVAVDDVVDQQAGVTGVELPVGAKLAARGDPDRGVAELRPRFRERRLGDVAGDDAEAGVGRAGPRIAGPAVPAGDPDAVEAGVADLVDLDRLSRAMRDELHRRVERDGSQLGIDRFPEGVEIVRAGHRCLVILRQATNRHEFLPY